ncbi:hypothetical protein [Halosimplex pelagicum]|uniref:Immunity 49 family protein n=1 Tax=Halosimplex pelagicum TaxID=869886 RepID=A0A7D5P5X8_9EURY|nr:hypothetical protein [Halosimplex pelagicum]QLH81683.1 hypothetical protein HZS54_08615 [Halosimplex pelagicum]
MTDMEERIRENLEWSISSVDQKLEAIKNSEENLRQKYNSLAMREQSIAVFYLVLGDRSQSKKWFGSSAAHKIKSVEQYRQYTHEGGSETWENEPLKVQKAMFSSILSQDEETIQNATNAALEIPEAYPEEYHGTRSWYDLVLTLSKCIRTDMEYQRHLKDLVEYADVFGETAALQDRGTASAIEGIVNEDNEQIADGIADMIPLHEKENDIGSPKASALVCRPAAAIYTFALMHGLDPEIDREYVPEALDDSYIEIRY